GNERGRGSWVRSPPRPSWLRDWIWTNDLGVIRCLTAPHRLRDPRAHDVADRGATSLSRLLASAKAGTYTPLTWPASANADLVPGSIATRNVPFIPPGAMSDGCVFTGRSPRPEAGWNG